MCNFCVRLASAKILKHFRLTRCKRCRLIRVASLNQVTVPRRKHTSVVRHNAHGSKNVGDGDILRETASTFGK